MVPEQRTKTVCYTVCKPVCEQKTVHCYKCVPRTECYTKTVCCPKWVCKQVEVKVADPCCEPNCGCAEAGCGCSEAPSCGCSN
jgi:hypothetical protein